MGRPERPLDPDAGPVQLFAHQLRQLREAAGRPTYRELAARTHYSPSVLSRAAAGEDFPSLEVTLAFVAACSGDLDLWEHRWRAASEEQARTPSARASTDLPDPREERPETRSPHTDALHRQGLRVG